MSSDAIRVLSDGTLAYRDWRVVLYIRETSFRGGDGRWEPEERSLPRFHVACCRTLEAMWLSGRAHRNVVSTREDGLFDLKIQGSASFRALRVCKNCLETLDWQGFQSADPAEREAGVRAFVLRDFFDRYGRQVSPGSG